ncbi:hypothetical protein YSA_02050 [Pseudomonas putida ND6]|uniref:Uncharacterized protein n=1 Tax=Pseudomonas putida ND6 TaxID=231023 RepID=I3UQV8_PSEPU|nr:hypothetical protein YSA_02050 [Pseudomonas putida ND6]
MHAILVGAVVCGDDYQEVSGMTPMYSFQPIHLESR